MRSSLFLLAAAGGVVLSACQGDSTPSAPTFTKGPSARPGASATAAAVPLTGEERRLIARLAAMYPRDKAAVVSEAFDDPFMVGSKAPQNPRAQALIDSIDVIRRARIDSITRAARIIMANQPAAIPATVILLPQLPDSSVAVVWRRAHAIPHDVIALRADHATIGALGAGLRLLMQLRRAGGDSAVTDGHYTAFAEHVPQQWRADDGVFANGDLARLRSSEPVSIPPFGNVRSRTVWLTSAKAAAGNR